MSRAGFKPRITASAAATVTATVGSVSLGQSRPTRHVLKLLAWSGSVSPVPRGGLPTEKPDWAAERWLATGYRGQSCPSQCQMAHGGVAAAGLKLNQNWVETPALIVQTHVTVAKLCRSAAEWLTEGTAGVTRKAGFRRRRCQSSQSR